MQDRIDIVLASLEAKIKAQRDQMFQLNDYSNVANVKNTTLMACNYEVYVFLYENIRKLNKNQTNLFLNRFVWIDENSIDLSLYDFKIIKQYHNDALHHDFEKEQLNLFA